MSRKRRNDVVVAGAGPAGLIAATLLARAGKNVTVAAPADRRTPAGESVPGATGRLLKKLDLPSLDTGHHRTITGVMSVWGPDRRIEDSLAHPEGGGWRLDRARFETDLEQSAKEAGVTFLRSRIRSLTYTKGTWTLATANSPHLRAGTLVDATGYRSHIARLRGAPRTDGSPLVAVWAIGTPPPEPTRRTLVESVEDGWWYGACLPDGRPLAAFFSHPDLALPLKRDPALWLRALGKTELVSQHLSPKNFRATVPHSADAKSSWLTTPHGPGWIACGDAALKFEPLSSQGIFHALASGEMVARALLDDDCDLEEYANNLHNIRRIYLRRAKSYYEIAARHFGGLFWDRHLEGFGGLPPSDLQEAGF